MLVALAVPAWAGTAVVRDWDLIGPLPYTALAPHGVVDANWNIHGPACFTCNTRLGLQKGPHWQSCVWRVVWNPIDTTGGVGITSHDEAAGADISNFPSLAQITGVGGGIRTDTRDVTAAMNALIGLSGAIDLVGETKANTTAVTLYSSRIHCVSVNLAPVTPTGGPTNTPTPTVTPTRTPGGDFFCPRP